MRSEQLVRVCLECEGENLSCWQCGGDGTIPVVSEFDADIRVVTSEIMADPSLGHGIGALFVEISGEQIGSDVELTAEDDSDEGWRG